jgi:RNA polymerase sigma-70 factor (ECF subfamily)
LNRERRWSDQVRDEATLTALPANDHEREFPRELIESLPQLVGNLSPASRTVVVLFYLHELSLVETAAVLDIPVGTAKSRLAYGLESLRRTFQREEK